MNRRRQLTPRVFIRAVCLIASLAVTACGGGGSTTVTTDPPPTTTTQPATGTTTPPTTGATTPATTPTATTTPATTPTATTPAATTVTIAGTVRFESVPSDPASGALRYSATVAKPIRGAVIELYSSPANQLLASASSDDQGKYSISVNNPGTPVWLRVRAQLLQQTAPGWDIRVADNTQSNALYVLDTQPAPISGAALTLDATAATGWTGAGYGAARSAAPFAILDSLYIALQKVRSAEATRAWPRLDVYWSVNNRPSAGDPAQGLISSTLYAGVDPKVVDGPHRIYVLGKADVDTDEFDNHVITHEFGHYLQNVASRNDSLGGSHGIESLDMRVAFSEGWGDGWSTIATADPVYVDTSGPAQASASIHDFSKPVTTDQGWYKSDSVAYLFWKFNEQLGFPVIWQAFTGTTSRNTSAVSELHLFAVALKVALAAPASAAIVDSLLASQGTKAEDQFGSSETNNGGIADVLPLYKPYPGVGGSPCVTVDASTPDPLNKLGNWAFIRVSLATTKSYTIALTGGTDPDFTLIGNNGFRRLANSSSPGSETLTVTLNAGEYVIAATEFVRAGRTCLTLTIN